MSELALLGGPRSKGKPFPLWPQHDETEKEALIDVLESGVWWRTPGTRTLKFEASFADYHQATHAIAITNGTAALEVTLAALGIGPGDEVIVPDFTFVATASAVLFTGAMPIMVDVLPDTYCIDPDLVEEAITERTKAIIVVHLGGHPADLDRLTALAKKHDLQMIEDSAHAHASEWHGKKIGTFGTAGTFSFQASKLMTAGEGGIIISNDDDFELKARSIHDCGRMPGEWFYSHFIYGSNYRLSEWQSAVLNAQLDRLDSQTALRHKNAQILDALLSEIDGITPQALDPRCTRNGHYAYIFHFDKSKFANVPTCRFIEAMIAEGIPNQASYPPVHALDLFQSGAYKERLDHEQSAQEYAFLKNEYPNTERGAWETVWITHNALLGDEEDLQEISSAIKKIQSSAKEL